MSDNPKTRPAENEPSNRIKDPEDWTTGDEPMTGAQASYLKTLCEEAGEEFDDSLTKAEASKRIDELQEKTGRGQPSAEPRLLGRRRRRLRNRPGLGVPGRLVAAREQRGHGQGEEHDDQGRDEPTDGYAHGQTDSGERGAVARGITAGKRLIPSPIEY